MINSGVSLKIFKFRQSTFLNSLRTDLKFKRARNVRIVTILLICFSRFSYTPNKRAIVPPDTPGTRSAAPMQSPLTTFLVMVLRTQGTVSRSAPNAHSTRGASIPTVDYSANRIIVTGQPPVTTSSNVKPGPPCSDTSSPAISSSAETLSPITALRPLNRINPAATVQAATITTIKA